jgi:hypothetical protein
VAVGSELTVTLVVACAEQPEALTVTAYVPAFAA